MPNCTECKFFLDGKNRGPSVCRRFPPVMALDVEAKSWVTNFVIIGVPKEVWCGEFSKALILQN